jgi:hypothetical protein
MPIAEARRRAREEITADARAFTSELGLPVDHRSPDLIVATGHQPDLFHPGIWVKDFLLQRLADETGAVPIDFLVDSDAFDTVRLTAPCLDPEVRVREEVLVAGSEGGCYACAQPPEQGEIERFRRAGASGLRTLPAAALAKHFETYCECLAEACSSRRDLASALVLARRLYERPASTSYLEEPVTRMSSSRAFLSFLAHIALDAPAFASDHNAELARFREATKTRSAAQPFPDLRVEGGLVELPVWSIADERGRVWVRDTGSTVDVIVADERIAALPKDIESAASALDACEPVFAPRALLLTLFVRMLVADLFIHGVGGARYDQVTDALAHRYFGVELPPYVTASMTMYLPIGIPMVTEQEVAEARDALHRMTHNPDSFLADVEFESEEQRREAAELALHKGELVEAIGAPDADKKELGRQIRESNERLEKLLEPVAGELRESLRRAESGHRASSILTDRSYPFCLWSPLEVQDKAT